MHGMDTQSVSAGNMLHWNLLPSCHSWEENRSKGPCDIFDPWVRLGEGSGWDLRMHPAAPPAASGNLGT